MTVPTGRLDEEVARYLAFCDQEIAMAKATQQEKQHDKIGPGNGSGRQRDAHTTTNPPGAPKR